MGASDRRKLWICRFAWTTQTRCPHTHSSDRKKRRKRLDDSFEEEENRNGRRLYTLIPKAPGPTDGVHLRFGNRLFQYACGCTMRSDVPCLLPGPVLSIRPTRLASEVSLRRNDNVLRPNKKARSGMRGWRLHRSSLGQTPEAGGLLGPRCRPQIPPL